MFYWITAVVVAAAVFLYLRQKKQKTQETETETPKTEPITGGATETYDTPQVKDGDAVYWYENGEKKEGTVKVMPQGLQVFDANGNIVIDVTTRLTKYLGTGDTGTTDGSLVNNALADGDVWVIPMEITLEYGSGSDGVAYPYFTKSGTTLQWTFSDDKRTRTRQKFMYGIY